MRIAIVGAGGIGAVHARHAARIPDVEILVHDRDVDKATTLAQAVGGRVVTGMGDTISECDAAVICVPTDLHVELSLPFLKEGKRLLIEKPLARTLTQADELSAFAGLIAVGQVVRYFADHRKVHDVVKEGSLGKPAAARVRRSGGKPKNWDGWFGDYSRSGGVLLDLAVHDFDWLRWTIGEVESVFSCSAKASDPTLEGDFALTTLKMREGAVCHSESSWMDTSFRTSIEVSGPLGSIEVDSRVNPTVRIDLPGSTQMFSPQAPADDPYFLQMQAFASFAQGEQSNIATYEDGRAAVQIALAAVESAQTGQTVHL
ncbi:MAG: Gfo/Idh/MocA family oxidoreductase [Armatimonadota bacterium]